MLILGFRLRLEMVKKLRKNKAGIKRRNVKLTNKHLNKLAKQGKLKSRLKHKWDRLKGQVGMRENVAEREPESDDGCENEDAMPLDMIDQDLPLPMPSTSALTGIEDYEKVPRKFAKSGSGSSRVLLPIKTYEGKVVAQEADMESEGEQEIQEELSPESSTEPQNLINWSALTPVERLRKKQQLLEDYKIKIADVCSKVLTDPEHNLRRLKLLLGFLRKDAVEPVLRLAVEKLSIGSLMEIFVDIIPGYSIRKLTDKELEQKIKKDTKQMREYEELLLKYYKTFVDRLISHLRSNSKLRKPQREIDETHPQYQLKLLSLRCVCRLLLAHPHFNYRQDLISVLAVQLASADPKISQQCCECLEQLFTEDRVREVSVGAVKAIANFIKTNLAKPHRISATVLRPFLALNIHDVEAKDEQGKTKKDRLVAKKDKLSTMSKKERKHYKLLATLERELQEVEAGESRNTKLKHNTEIMNFVFATYFRILKSNVAHLLPETLAGLSKFAHLINVDFFDDLFHALHQLLDGGTLKVIASLHCVHTAFIVLSGEGEALTIDPYRFYKHVYGLIPKLLKCKLQTELTEAIDLLLTCLDIMINKRRKLVSLSRVAAFAKRLSLMLFVLPDHLLVPVACAIASYMNTHSNSVLRSYINYILSRSPDTSGVKVLPSALLQKTPKNWLSAQTEPITNNPIISFKTKEQFTYSDLIKKISGHRALN